MEELGDFIGHETRKHQQEQTHAQASEVFPQAPGEEPETHSLTSSTNQQLTSLLTSHKQVPYQVSITDALIVRPLNVIA